MANFLTVKKQKMLIKSDFFYNKNDFKNQIIRRKNWIKNNPDLKADLEWNFMIKNIKIEKIKKVTKIGLAFSFQKISSIPINQYDKRLDFIITEKEILR